MKYKIHDLSLWNQNKEIYKILFQQYDPDQQYFSTFNYDLIQHTNLDNFFFEIKNNYKVQYTHIKNLLKNFSDDLHTIYKNNKMNKLQSETYLSLTQNNNKWVDPSHFNHLALQIQIQIKPGDLINLKKHSGLGLYFVYQNKDLGNIMYTKKTLGVNGIHLPSQAWKFIQNDNWCYHGMPFGGCYLPKNAKISDNNHSLNNKHGFYLFIPKQYLDNPTHAQNLNINGKNYQGRVIDMGPT